MDWGETNARLPFEMVSTHISISGKPGDPAKKLLSGLSVNAHFGGKTVLKKA